MYLDEHIGNIVVNKPEVVREDSIVNEVVENFKERSRIGILKYNTTLDRDDLSLEQWLSHAIEEAMDLTLYLTKIKRELKNKIKYDATTENI